MMDRIVIVTKESPLEELVREHQTESAAAFALELEGRSITQYLLEAATYREALTTLRRQIPNDLSVAEVSRLELSAHTFRPKDLIIVCGPDGLFANVAKYVADQPVLTVNPGVFGAGVLMLFSPNEVGELLQRIQAGKHVVEKLPFVKAAIGDDRVLWGINDLFIGRRDHVSARYEISFGGRHENQSSSGVIVSTGIGSTGWMCSIATMVTALTRESQQHKLSMLPTATSNELVFVVREPFPSQHTGTSIVTGCVSPGRPLVFTSQMPTGGYIFSDGGVEKGLRWAAGKSVTISVGERHVQRVIR